MFVCIRDYIYQCVNVGYVFVYVCVCVCVHNVLNVKGHVTLYKIEGY